MTNIGDQLLQPEPGWKRIDDSHSSIIYIGDGWTYTKDYNLFHNKTMHYIDNGTYGKIIFKFYGNKLRIIAQAGTDVHSSDCKITIDGTEYTYSAQLIDEVKRQVLLYENTDLETDTHTVELGQGTGPLSISLDAIDINEDGYMVAQIGTQLLQPDPGWRRFDDSDPKIVYEGTNWSIYNDSLNHYNKTLHCTTKVDPSNKIKIKFYGSKIRIIERSGSDYNPTDDKISIDGVIYNINSHDVGGSYIVQALVFEITSLEKGFHEVELLSGTNATYPLTLDAIDIDEDGYLLTEDEYLEELSNTCIIKSDGKYYTITDNMLVEVTGEITSDFIKENGIKSEELVKNLSILPNTFKLITRKDMNVKIKAIKSTKELVVASDNFSSKVSENIDYFKTIYEKNGESSIMLALSIDNGKTWLGNNFDDLGIQIPLKPYSELSEDDISKWNKAREIIYNQGISVENLNSLDFNTLEFEFIRFAYVLSITNATDVCRTTKLQWQFDAKGSMELMDSSDIKIEVMPNLIKVTPKTEQELIKLNITNGTCISNSTSGDTGSDSVEPEEIEEMCNEIFNYLGW